jgi:hypothetical protein
MFLFNFLSYVILLFVYVFLWLCMYCCVYSLFIVPTGTLRLPDRVFRAFSSVVRQIPEYTSQRRGTTRTLPKLIVLFCVLFVCKCVLYYCHKLQLTYIYLPACQPACLPACCTIKLTFILQFFYWYLCLLLNSYYTC